MSRTVKLCLASAAVAILLPIASGALPVIKSILPAGTGTLNRVIHVKGVKFTGLSSVPPVAIWINRKSDCRFLTAPPDFGGIADANGDYFTPATSLTAYNPPVTNGDVVCVGPPYFQQTVNGPVPRCNCVRVQ